VEERLGLGERDINPTPNPQKKEHPIFVVSACRLSFLATWFRLEDSLPSHSSSAMTDTKN